MTAPTLPGGFVAPFRGDAVSWTFVWDANNQMAADFVEGDAGDVVEVRARGWGRIQKMPHADEVMDAWEEWVRAAVGDSIDPVDVVQRMNDSALLPDMP